MDSTPSTAGPSSGVSKVDKPKKPKKRGWTYVEEFVPFEQMTPKEQKDFLTVPPPNGHPSASSSNVEGEVDATRNIEVEANGEVRNGIAADAGSAYPSSVSLGGQDAMDIDEGSRGSA